MAPLTFAVDQLEFAMRRQRYGDEHHVEVHAFHRGRHVGVLEAMLTTPWGVPDERSAGIEFVFVHRAYRRHGVATALLDELTRCAGERDFYFGDATPAGREFCECVGAERVDDHRDVRSGAYGKTCPVCKAP